MTIEYNELLEKTNPLDWHQDRFLTTMPDHFIRVPLKETTDQIELFEWIIHNIAGRVAITHKTESEKVANVFQKQMMIGFENPADATLFTLFYS